MRHCCGCLKKVFFLTNEINIYTRRHEYIYQGFKISTQNIIFIKYPEITVGKLYVKWELYFFRNAVCYTQCC